mmetsp:Transcript_1029/g.1602  ORF Transcript_1029/g.1602 Transcript_1029/m.1602 type:complete len:437 (+) Transcript_1029:51-1361(+)
MPCLPGQSSDVKVTTPQIHNQGLGLSRGRKFWVTFMARIRSVPILQTIFIGWNVIQAIAICSLAIAIIVLMYFSEEYKETKAHLDATSYPNFLHYFIFDAFMYCSINIGFVLLQLFFAVAAVVNERWTQLLLGFIPAASVTLLRGIQLFLEHRHFSIIIYLSLGVMVLSTLAYPFLILLCYPVVQTFGLKTFNLVGGNPKNMFYYRHFEFLSAIYITDTMFSSFTLAITVYYFYFSNAFLVLFLILFLATILFLILAHVPIGFSKPVGHLCGIPIWLRIGNWIRRENRIGLGFLFLFNFIQPIYTLYKPISMATQGSFFEMTAGTYLEGYPHQLTFRIIAFFVITILFFLFRFVLQLSIVYHMTMIHGELKAVFDKEAAKAIEEREEKKSKALTLDTANQRGFSYRLQSWYVNNVRPLLAKLHLVYVDDASSKLDH